MFDTIAICRSFEQLFRATCSPDDVGVYRAMDFKEFVLSVMSVCRLYLSNDFTLWCAFFAIVGTATREEIDETNARTQCVALPRSRRF